MKVVDKHSNIFENVAVDIFNLSPQPVKIRKSLKPLLYTTATNPLIKEIAAYEHYKFIFNMSISQFSKLILDS